MNYNELEDMLLAFTVFCIFMTVPLMLYTVCNRRAPRWYRVVRVSVRLYIRAWNSSVY